MHERMMPRGTGTSTRARRLAVPRVVAALTVVGLLAGAAGCARPERPAGTIVMASGTDLESGNPLVTIHPLSVKFQ